MSQNATEIVRLLRTLIFFLKTDEFFEKKWIIQKSVKFANLSQNTTKIVKVLKTFKILFFLKKKLDDFSQKKHEFLKFAKDSKIVVECDWNITISQNVPFFPKNWWIFLKKMNNLKIGKCSKVVTECDRNSKSSQKVRNLIFKR